MYLSNSSLRWKYKWQSGGFTVSGIYRLLGKLFHWLTTLWQRFGFYKSTRSFVEMILSLNDQPKLTIYIYIYI